MNMKMITLSFFKLCIVHVKKTGQFFFHTYLLTCLNKDTLALLKVIFEQVLKLSIKIMVLSCIGNLLRKNTLPTIAHLVVFTHAFSVIMHLHVLS